MNLAKTRYAASSAAVLVLLLALAGCEVASEPASDVYRPVMPPEHMVYVWWEWISDEGEFESLDIDFTIHNDIVGFSGRHGLYLMLGFGHIAGIPFYFGLQTDVDDPCVGVSRQGLDLFEMGNSRSG